jgi:hypothetical protein
METIGYYLFDNWRAGVIAAMVLEVAALLWWAFTRSRKSSLALLIGPFLVGLTLLLDWAVETNREQAERITRQIVQAPEDEDAELLISLLNPTFSPNNGWDYPRLCGRIRTLLSQPLIQQNRITELIVENADKTRSQVKLIVVTVIDPKCSYRVYTPIVKTQWRFDFTRTDKQEFRLNRFTMLSLNDGEPIDVLSDPHL